MVSLRTDRDADSDGKNVDDGTFESSEQQRRGGTPGLVTFNSRYIGHIEQVAMAALV